MLFSRLSDDVILNIFSLLADDPRHWARLACVNTKFSSLIRDVCSKSICLSSIPDLASDLIHPSTSSSSSSSAPPGGWHSLFKVSVCCPGLVHSGVLLDHSDFGLLRDLNNHSHHGGGDCFEEEEMESVPRNGRGGCEDRSEVKSHRHRRVSCCSSGERRAAESSDLSSSSSSLSVRITDRRQIGDATPPSVIQITDPCPLLSVQIADQSQQSDRIADQTQPSVQITEARGSDESNPSWCWSLYDDLYNDTIYNNLESDPSDHQCASSSSSGKKKTSGAILGQFSVDKRRKISRPLRSHLAPGAWNLSREQGNKLLASRFRSDCLYICDWPGCVHVEEKRNYMLFRGVFKNFKRSGVWRTIRDGNRKGIELGCAFCGCRETWDLHSAFCLRRVFGFHDDGEPVVRAYVCENGHVSGAWTEWPLYT